MNKTVLITGGSRGIGKAMVYKFAQAGYNVLLNFTKPKCSAFEHLLKVLQIQYSKLNVSMSDTFKKFIQFISY